MKCPSNNRHCEHSEAIQLKRHGRGITPFALQTQRYWIAASLRSSQ